MEGHAVVRCHDYRHAPTTHLTFSSASRSEGMSTEPNASRRAWGTWVDVAKGWAVETETCSRIKAMTTWSALASSGKGNQMK